MKKTDQSQYAIYTDGLVGGEGGLRLGNILWIEDFDNELKEIKDFGGKFCRGNVALEWDFFDALMIANQVASYSEFQLVLLSWK